MGTYNSDPSVQTLATALSQDADAKGKIYARLMQVHSNTMDDFSQLEGAAGSAKPFWKATDLKADGGDSIKFTAMSDLGGPGVRGEAELTGNTSSFRIGGYSVPVDFWRDGVELTKKQLKFLAAGGDVPTQLARMLGEKLGRQKQADMMIALIKKASGNIMRPSNRTSRNAITADDTLTPSFCVEACARLAGLGGKPIALTRSKSGSPVYSRLIFAGQDALVEFRNSNSWQQAILNAALRGDSNPAFSGKLLDWQGHQIWEHTVVDPDADDAMGSPIAPKAKLGVAITAGTAVFDIQQSTATKPLYFGFFPGYDWIWVEGQTAAPDSTTYYAYIIDPAQPSTDAPGGKAMFVSYVGTGNNGNKITITNRLASAAGVAAVTTLGSVTWDADLHTDRAGVGSWIIPTNSRGEIGIGYSFAFGAGAASRAYGSITAGVITESRDYGFIKGMGREAIFGQEVRKDSLGKPRSYILMEHGVEHPGIVIPRAAS